jgi:hypothetical protein
LEFLGLATCLVTAFHVKLEESQLITLEWIRTAIQDYIRIDDVFEEAFLQVVILYGAHADRIVLTPDAREYLAFRGNKHVVCTNPPLASLPGPYLWFGGQLRDVWRLVSDSHGTCTATLKPQSK